MTSQTWEEHMDNFKHKAREYLVVLHADEHTSSQIIYHTETNIGEISNAKGSIPNEISKLYLHIGEQLIISRELALRPNSTVAVQH